MKKSIMFLCTGNSCRSQMADGLCKKYLGDQFDVYSAGIVKHGINPYAQRVMGELGIDISKNESNTIDELPLCEFDYVVTVCSHADSHCPTFPANTKVIHFGFDDPPKLTENYETDEERLPVYRRVRDEIKTFIIGLEKEL
ncbi:MAG: arsenate reductase ArsC [Bacteriovoracaceae bacterium]|nr:arsenate reductase ArsC [Bacteriovoracaceae bacterium]